MTGRQLLKVDWTTTFDFAVNLNLQPGRAGPGGARHLFCLQVWSERERVCVSVCERERECEREGGRGSKIEREREKESEKESERK